MKIIVFLYFVTLGRMEEISPFHFQKVNLDNVNVEKEEKIFVGWAEETGRWILAKMYVIYFEDSSKRWLVGLI